jgi:GNAT superfamily N-acetyltransferase
VRIQLAERRHLARIPAIERAAATVFPEADLPQHLRHGVTHRDVLRTAQEDRRIWVALCGNSDVVGFARAEIVDDIAHLDEMDVLPSHSRRGIGTRLVQAVRDWATAAGFDAITLVTFEHLPWNAPFYEKLGFARLDRAELGPGMTSLIEEEAAAGINVGKRTGMKLLLKGNR